MAVITVAHKPELTKAQAQETFAKHFAGKYTVEDFRGLFRDFTVVKNPFVGVAVKLDQTSSETKFVYGGAGPEMVGTGVPGRLDRLSVLGRADERGPAVHGDGARVPLSTRGRSLFGKNGACLTPGFANCGSLPPPRPA